MTKKADIGSKRLISLAPERWAQWVTGRNLTARQLLDTQFQWLEREGDVLLRVHSSELGEFLIATEIQLRYTQLMPRRMRAYTALAEEKFQLPTYAVLVIILPPQSSTAIANCYQSQLLDQQARQDYRVIKLWEIDATIPLERPLLPLLPFVPIMQGGDQPSLIRQAVQLLRNDPNLSELENLLGFFASFVIETELIREIMR